MANYNNLSVTTTVSANDLAAVYSNQNGTTQGVSLNNLKTFFQAGVPASSFLAGNGVNIISSSFNNNNAFTFTGITTTLTAMSNPYPSSITNKLFPSNTTAFSAAPSNLRFIANRDISLALVHFYCMPYSLTTLTALNFALRIGSATTFYDDLILRLGFSTTDSGVPAQFSCYCFNPLNANNVIKQNETVSLMVSGNASGSASFRGISFAITSLDGV